jgi:hypothetical protein
MRPFPQDPTACSDRASPGSASRAAALPVGSLAAVLADPAITPDPNSQCSTNEQPPQDTRLRCGSGRNLPDKPTDAPGAP